MHDKGSSERVLTIIGDGALQMTIQELTTVAWMDVTRPIVMCLNNRGYIIEEARKIAFLFKKT